MRKPMLILLMIAPLLLITIASSGAAQVESGILHTSDNICISYDHFKNGSDSVIVICPGFYNSKQNRWMRKTAALLSGAYDVLLFDFRGHGKSGGRFTWSAKEYMDLNAVIDYAKAQGYRHIGIVAFSLGASAAVNSAAGRDDIESMVLISCPSRFNMIDFRFWELGMWFDLKDNIECGWEGKGARPGNIFLLKNDPIDMIGRTKKTSVLFIHGDNDWVVKDRHSRKLYAAAVGEKKLEIIKGGLHAERLIQFYPEEMKKLILEWFSHTLK